MQPKFISKIDSGYPNTGIAQVFNFDKKFIGSHMAPAIASAFFISLEFLYYCRNLAPPDD